MEQSFSHAGTAHFFDAHTHVQFSAYGAERDAVIARARAADVWLINVGTQRDTSRMAVELADRFPEGVYAAVGLHPIHTGKSYHDEQELGGGDAAKAFTSRGEVFDMEYYRTLAMHPRVVAIGECGLDYFHFDDAEPRESQIMRQKEAFAAQMQLTKEIKKPLMIHCRDAFDEVIAMLRAAPDGYTPGVVHFFTGTKEHARAFMDLGFSFTFGGAITFPPRKGQSEGSYDEVVRYIPIDHLISETDAPYVAPVPFRGAQNEPAYVVHTVARLAELKGVDPEAMKIQIFENARRVFRV